MTTVRRIYWGRVVVGGLSAEFLLVVLVGAVRAAFGETAFLASVLIGSAAMPFLFALWVCRGGRPHALLNGALVGGMAMVFYIVLFAITSPGQSQPLLYQAAHVLKVLAGLSGGFVAGRRRTSRRGSAAPAV